MLTRLAELLLFGIIPYLVGSFAASSADVERELSAAPIVQLVDDDAVDDGPVGAEKPER
ncbi:MAG: hypothetical protein AB7P20_06570 [Rhizobiaceae bacterium]